MTLPPDLALLDSAGKDALILALFERLNDLTARLEILEADNAALRAENAALRAENAVLRAENAELRAKLNLPPKKPDNSSTPPSRGGIEQTAVHSYDRIELPEIRPEVIRVTLLGRHMPVLQQAIQGHAPGWA